MRKELQEIERLNTELTCLSEGFHAVKVDLRANRAITSESLPFGLKTLWHWDWRAEAVEAAFHRLAPQLS